MNLKLTSSDIMDVVRDVHQSIRHSISILRTEDVSRDEALKYLDHADNVLKALEKFTEE